MRKTKKALVRELEEKEKVEKEEMETLKQQQSKSAGQEN